jgi:hypothetical protein
MADRRISPSKPKVRWRAVITLAALVLGPSSAAMPFGGGMLNGRSPLTSN